MKMKQHHLAALVSTFLSLLVAACSAPEKLPEHLDVAAPPPSAQPNSNDEWARRQMMITYEGLDDTGKVVKTFEDDSKWAVDAIGLVCGTDCSDSFPTPIFEWCGCAASRVAYKTCLAQNYLALANVQAQPITINLYPNGVTIPQNVDGYKGLRVSYPGEAAAVGLATNAIQEGQAAVGLASDVLSWALQSGGTSAPFDCRTVDGSWEQLLSNRPETDGRMADEFFSSLLVADYDLTKQAYDRAIEATVNASDAARSSTKSASDSGVRQQTAEHLSRAAAAHLLVGGDPGFMGSTENPLCVGPELSSTARAALLLLKESGFPNYLLVDPPTIYLEDVLNGSPESVRDRLGKLRGIPELSQHQKTVQQWSGLSTDDFAAARSYFIQESNVFARSPRATLPPVPGGQNPALYAGTIGDPSPLPGAAWAARARFRGPAAMTPNANDIANADGLEGFIGATHLAVDAMLQNFGDAPPLLSSVVVTGEYEGEVIYTFRGTDPSNLPFETQAPGFTADDRVRIVVGEDGLRCALEGEIEGAVCVADNRQMPNLPPAGFPCAGTGTAPSLACLTLVTLDQNIASETGPIASGESPSEKVPYFADGKTRIYWVKPKSATSRELPGEYEVLTGAIVDEPSPRKTVELPIVPTVEQRVAGVLAPNRKFCALPETTCAGVTFDKRLPLEDELTDDNNGVESSWQHYLGLAKQAAQEADLQAQKFLDTKFNVLGDARDAELRKEENRQRAEEALTALQSACGTAIDPRHLLDLLAARVDPDCTGRGCWAFEGLVANSCTGAPDCDRGYKCQAGRCILDFVEWAKGGAGQADEADPDLKRLLRCLDDGPDSVVPFVTMGKLPMCVYTDANDPNSVCPSSLIARGCPSNLQNDTCNSVPGTNVTVSVPLKYFDNPSRRVVVQGADDPGPCDRLRTLRHSVPTRLLDADEIRNSGTLHPDFLRDKIKNLSFRSGLGGYGGVYVGDAARYSTGDIVNGPTRGWPCSDGGHARYPKGCESDPASVNSLSLFCSSAACGSEVTRGQMTYRLLKATMAASWMLNGSFPFVFFSNTDSRYDRDHNPCLDDPSSVETIYEDGDLNKPIYVCHHDRGTRYEFRSTEHSYAWTNPDGSDATNGAAVVDLYSTSQSLPAPQIPWFKDRRTRETFFFGGLADIVASPDTKMWANEVLRFGEHPNEIGQLKWPYKLLEGINIRSYFPWGELTGYDFMDGLELLCELSQSSPLEPPPATVEELERLDSAADALDQVAALLQEKQSALIFANVPALAMDALQETTTTGTFPELSGAMAEQVATLRAQFVRAHGAQYAVAAAVQQMGAETHLLKAQLDQIGKKKELVYLDTMSSQLDRMNDCTKAMGTAQWDKPQSYVTAAGTCVIDVLQTLIDSK